ncbi:uncharacterized protein BO80DRAFT_229635 [Aspergillus ibericus CBS 121593]|uniref:Uncharacterized protein n=1 Tax=Aspergillus ibericus CBS 121593 TaxID=1448316 RepID=A0A395GLG4_9EURO|nr:hypothetical protein BO80DRAFT_229635 [Aspergillus ibericus CBS 121593]RAK96309.1 hypothetical protein BO80DRAFT_229635 [Aspergillus ibericus CBS 121593]
MPSNKDRLYVVLYARGGAPTMPGKEDTYHWSFIVGPKIETEGKRGVRYHAKEKPKAGGGSTWLFEEFECQLTATSMLLVRVMVGKVEDGNRLVQILRTTPIRQDQVGWNCVVWIREALERLKADNTALGTSVIDWETVRNASMAYCQRKKDQHRFDGQGNFDMAKAPTYDLIERKETII